MSNTLDLFDEIFYDDYYPGTLWVEAGKQKVIYWTDRDPSFSVSGKEKQVSRLTSFELSIAERAFNEWDQVLDSLEFKYTSDPSKAQIAVGWSDISPWGYWTASWSNNIRYTATLELNQDARYSSLISSTNLKHTLLHEIGNIIGLGDINRNLGIDSVLVDPFVITGYLTAKDKEYAKLLYSETVIDPTTPTSVAESATTVRTLTYANGDVYVGEFTDGQLTGQGTFTFASGGVYVGAWKDDQFNGQGTYTFASGNVYVGEWKDGQRNGQGTYTYENGLVQSGVWLKGSLVDASKGAIYSVTASSTSYDEGQIAQFSLITTSVDNGAAVAYTISGVSASDLESGSLTGTTTVGSSGTTLIDIPLALDKLTEGAETLTITLDDYQDKSASVIVNDTSKGAAIETVSTGWSWRSALTKAERTDIIELYVLAGNGAPGTTRLVASMEEFKNSGIAGVAASITEAASWAAKFPSFQTPEEFAKEFLDMIVPGFPEAGMAEGVKIIADLLNSGSSQADVLTVSSNFLSNASVTDAAFGDYAAKFQNQTAVAEFHTVTQEKDTPLSLTDITSDVATVVAAKSGAGNGTFNSVVQANGLVDSSAPQPILDEYGAMLDSDVMASTELGIAVTDHDLNATNIDLVGLAQSGVEYILYG